MSLLETTAVEYYRGEDKTILLEESSNNRAYPLVGLVDSKSGEPFGFPRMAFGELEVAQPNPKVQI